jgi:hypothetical protein
MRKLWMLTAALVLLASSLAAQAPEAAARPEVPGIKLGTDCWETTKGTQAELFLPAGACGAGSKPAHVTVGIKGVPLTVAEAKACGCQVDTKIEYIDPHGVTSSEKTRHAVKQVTTETTKVDTCVRRTKNAKFPAQAVPVKVDIQLVQLSLQSVQPIDCNNKKFTLCITESSKQPDGGGTMTFTPSTVGRLSKGSVKLGQLHIRYDVTFIAPGGNCADLPKGTLFTLKDTMKLTLKNGPRPGTFTQLVP